MPSKFGNCPLVIHGIDRYMPNYHTIIINYLLPNLIICCIDQSIINGNFDGNFDENFIMAGN